MAVDSSAPTDDDPATPDDWAVSAIVEVASGAASAAVLGADAESLQVALADAGCTVTFAAAGPDAPDAIAGEVVVLSGTPCRVADEVAHLAAVRAAMDATSTVIVAVPNITWGPRRLAAIEGRSPFGSGPLVDRPLRFFARGTVLDALVAAGFHPTAIRAVRRPWEIPDHVGPGVAHGADADTVGFVVVASPTSAAPDAPDPASGDAGDPSGPGWSDLRTAVRVSVEDANRQVAEAEAGRVALAARLEVAEAERARLARAVAERDETVAALEDSAGHRLQGRAQDALARVPGATRAARRVVSALRRRS